MSKKFKEKWIADWKKRMSQLSVEELELEKERRLRNIRRFELALKAAEWDLSYIEGLISEKEKA